MTDSEDLYASFSEHLSELRSTLIRMLLIILTGVGVAFFLHKPLISHLTNSLEQQGATLILLGPLDGLLTIMKLSFWVGLVGTSPLWLLYGFRFIAPALKKREKKWAFPLFLGSFLFMGTGIFFAQHVTIPIANQYLIDFNQGLGTNLWSLSHYLEYTVFILLGHALGFELALVLLSLVHFRILGTRILVSYRRHFIVAAFIIGALLTPPDVLTQFALAIPLIIFYEITIFYSKMKKQRMFNTSIGSEI